MEEIWAVIVTFNPDIDRLKENINAILPQVGGVVVVDNASGNVERIVDLIGNINSKCTESKIIIIKNDSNEGIAKGLNIGIGKAISIEGVKWIITLDQDTVVYDNIIEMYKHFLEGDSFSNDIVSVSCLRKDRNYIEKNNTKKDGDVDAVGFELVKSCITSGNLILAEAWNKVGGFDEKLFIDMVDDDFCIRLRLQGYKIARVNQFGYLHELGDSVRHVKFLGKDKVVIFCSDKRKYYLARNTRYIIKKYNFKINNEYSGYLFKRMLGTVLFEKNKVSGMKAYFKGLRAARKLLCTK